MQDFLVPDSSVIIKWLNQTDESNLREADQILTDCQSGKYSIIAPELAKYEIGNTFLYGKKLNIKQATVSLSSLYDLQINFIPLTEAAAQKTYEIAKEYSLTFYDASFLALAKLNDATLVTDNPKHQGKVKEVKVVALKDYGA